MLIESALREEIRLAGTCSPDFPETSCLPGGFTGKDRQQNAPARMTDLLIDPARRSGCQDLEKLGEVLEASVQRQRSPIDDVLDAGVVDEEPYMRELAAELGMEWLEIIPQAEAPLPLREAC